MPFAKTYIHYKKNIVCLEFYLLLAFYYEI